MIAEHLSREPRKDLNAFFDTRLLHRIEAEERRYRRAKNRWILRVYWVLALVWLFFAAGPLGVAAPFAAAAAAFALADIVSLRRYLRLFGLETGPSSKAVPAHLPTEEHR